MSQPPTSSTFAVELATAVAERTRNTGAPHIIFNAEQPVPLRNMLGGYVLLAGPITIILALVIMALKLDGWLFFLALLFIGIWQIVSGYLSYLIGAGRWLSHQASRDWHRLQTRIIEREFILRRQAEDNRHVEAMQNMGVQEMSERLLTWQREMEARLDALGRAQITDRTVEVLPTFVPAIPSRPRLLALDWASTLYGSDGKPNPKKVILDTGQLRVRWPGSKQGSWTGIPSAAGASSAECRQAEELLTSNVGGRTPVLISAANGRNMALNLETYPTLGRLLRIF